MSRVIKFRAINAKGEFIYGLPYTDSENETTYYDEYNNRMCWRNEGGAHCNMPYKNGTLQQFTGLKDCNGVEIYEGDILRGSYGIPGRLIIAPVEFCNAAFMVMSAGHNPSRCPLHEFLEHVPDAEIAGNIHQTPELLS